MTGQFMSEIEAGLDGEDHARRQDGVPVYETDVMSVHTQPVAHMMGEHLMHHLNHTLLNMAFTCTSQYHRIGAYY